MTILGIRCSNSDFTYAILDGKIGKPNLIAAKTICFPKDYTFPETLKWLLQELEDLNSNNNISSWAIKGAEPMAQKGKPYKERLEFEAMVSLSAANCGSSNVVRKTKPTIAKDLGLPGKAKALDTDLDQKLIKGLKGMTAKEFEAVLVAWSCL